MIAGRNCTQRFTRLAAAIIATGILAAPVRADLSAADKQAVAQMTLQWAVDGGIADFKLVKDPSEVIVADIYLPKNTKLVLANRKTTVMSLLRIQATADVKGDFLYFRIGPMSSKGTHATVPIALLWAIGVQSKTPYLSGGGATLEFEKRDGKWVQLPVTNRWMS